MWASVDTLLVSFFIILVENELPEALLCCSDGLILEVGHGAELHSVRVTFLAGFLQLSSHVASRRDPSKLNEVSALALLTL